MSDDDIATFEYVSIDKLIYEWRYQGGDNGRLNGVMKESGNFFSITITGNWSLGPGILPHYSLVYSKNNPKYMVYTWIISGMLAG